MSILPPSPVTGQPKSVEAASEADPPPRFLFHASDRAPEQEEPPSNSPSLTASYAEPDRSRPDPVEAVAYRGRMIEREDGPMVSITGKPLTRTVRSYLPENFQWEDWLCDRDRNGGRVGRDPMTIPLDVLSASGHPRTAARSVVFRMRIMHGVDAGDARDDGFLGLQPEDFPKSLTAIRETVCAPCSSDNMAEVRRCALIDCAAWPFRMGRNPHNPSRGRDMSAVRAAQKALSPADGPGQARQTNDGAPESTETP